MGDLTTLVGELLSLAHGIVGLPVCPGDWVWTITAAGMALALPVVLASCLVRLVRRFIGNHYTPVTVLMFALLGMFGTAVVPLLGFVGTATALRQAVQGTGSSGLTERDVEDLNEAYCFLPAQASYLGGGRSVSEALRALPGPDVLLAARTVFLLGALPLLALLLTWAMARLAVRRGPAWPGRPLWLPFLALLIGTQPLDEGVVGQLWLGYTTGVAAGLFLVPFMGRPPQSAVHRTPRSRALPRTLARLPAALVAKTKVAKTKIAETRLARAADNGHHPPGARFRRLRRLGEGGFGEVWLAVDTVLGREVAIKVAHVTDPDTEQRIRREARALAAVDHPHCVQVYDILSGIDDLPGLAIVMEYVPGPSLAQQVREQGPLSDTEGAYLWSTLAAALDAAHDRGVLHRDVKPTNIIIDEAGQAHLIDFGIARSVTDPALTAAGIVIGTPDYLPPEIAAGGAADPATDSWQLAATVSYALCGHPPRGQRDSAVAALLAAANREPMTQLPKHSAHHGLLQRALHPEARRRPTLIQVQTDLSRWLARTGRPAEGPLTRMLTGRRKT